MTSPKLEARLRLVTDILVQSPDFSGGGGNRDARVCAAYDLACRIQHILRDDTDVADQLRRASVDLYEARDLLVSWGAYASPEIQEKYGLDSDVSLIGLAALEAKRIAGERS